MTQYLMHIHRNECDFCHTQERWSNTYSCDDVAGTKYPKLTAVRSVPDLAPMAILELPIQHISICSRCAPGRDGVRNHATYADWRETLRKKHEAERAATLAAARTAAPSKTSHNLEDLA